MKKLCVFSTIISIDLPEEYFDEHMYKFYYNGSRDEDVAVALSSGKMIEIPNDATKKASVTGHTVYNFNGINYAIRSEYDKITYFSYDNGYTSFVLNINEKIDLGDMLVVDDLKIEISAVLRRIFIMLVTIRSGVCLHSASIKYKEYAIMFSGVSGTGKTTHANLWRTVFSDVDIINGDNGYLLIEDKNIYVYGSPWCGTSGECMSIKVPAKAVVFLEQAKENCIVRLSIAEAFMRLSARCFVPSWDEKLMLDTLNTTEMLANTINCYLLKCLPDKNAVKACYNGIYQS